MTDEVWRIVTDPEWQPRYLKLERGPGPGMFPNEAAKATATALLKICRNHIALTERQRLSDFKTMQFHCRLVDVASHFEYDREEDNEATYSDIKIICKSLIPSLRKLIEGLDSLEWRGRHLLNMAYCETQMEAGSYINIINHAKDITPKLLASCKEVSKVPATKSGKRAVNMACLSLWRVWEDMVGRPFCRNYEVSKLKVHRPNYTHEFVGSDARLLYALLRQLDSAVTYSQTRSALHYVAKRVNPLA